MSIVVLSTTIIDLVSAIILETDFRFSSITITSDSSFGSGSYMSSTIGRSFAVSKNLVISHSIISVSWNSSGFESGNSGSVSSSGFGRSEERRVVVLSTTIIDLVSAIILETDFRFSSIPITSDSSFGSGSYMSSTIGRSFAVSKNLVISHSIISVSWNSSGFESGNSGSVSSSGFGVDG